MQAAARGAPFDVERPQPVRRASRRLSETPTAFSPTDAPQTTSGSDGSRPPTSQSTRPVSGTSSRTHSADSLPVKKVRAPTVKKEAVPRAPRGGKKAAGTSRSTTTQRGKSVASSPAKPAAAPEASADDIDNITSGMKKIRINLITKSQKEAKERARMGAGKDGSSSIQDVQPVQPVAEETPTTRSPELKSEPGPEPEIVVASYEEPDLPPTRAESSVSHVPANASCSGFVTPVQAQTPFDSSSPAPHQVALPASSPVVPRAAPQAGGDPSDVFIPYQPEGPTPVAVAQTEPLQWLPPNAPASVASTPAANTPAAVTPAATPSMAKHSNLFHYAGGSGIPFAPRQQEESTKGPDNKTH